MDAACYCDFDPPETISVRTHVAKIRHVCSECRGWILPGERYALTWGVWDGPPETFRRCPDCQSVLDWIDAHQPCFCWTFTSLLSEARDAMYYLAEEDVPGMRMEMGRLLVRCRRRGRERRGEIMQAAQGDKT